MGTRTGAALQFGLYPRKGAIAVGPDEDFDVGGIPGRFEPGAGQIDFLFLRSVLGEPRKYVN